MAYPAGVTQATITVGGSIDWFGEQVKSLTADVTPVIGGGADHLVHRETGVTMVVASREFSDQGSGFLSFQLPHVDQRGWFDGSGRETTMWAYSVKVTVGLQDGSRKTWRKNVQPLIGQDSIDLDLVQDGQVTAPVAAPVPVVTSVNGQTGAVVIEGGGGSVDLSSYAKVEDLEPLARASDVTQGLSSKADADHTHPDLVTQSELSDGLAAKADADHTHQTADVVGLDDALSSKADAEHTHSDLEQRITALEDTPAGGTVSLVESPAGSGLYEIKVV